VSSTPSSDDGNRSSLRDVTFPRIPNVDKVQEATGLEIKCVPNKESQALIPEIHNESELKSTDV
jgi:hypothetical protein